jgi:hypothetical protein
VRCSSPGFYLNQAWVGDLETRPKNQKDYVWGLILPFLSWDFCFSAVGYSAKTKKMGPRSKTKVVLDCLYIHLFGLKRFFEF